MTTKLTPVHPGQILRADFMEPLDLSQNQLSLDLHVPATRISDIINGKRGITAETAIRLGRYFGTTAQFWINLQAHYDLEIAEDASAEKIAREVRPRELAAC